MQQLIPLIYYPLKVLILDDDKEMLHSIQDKFAHKFKISTITSTEEALSIIKTNAIDNQTLFKDITDRSAVDLKEGNNELSTLQFTIDTILDIVKDKHKYQKYGIIIVDYDMPKMNGIELCKELIHSPVKKILLTGKYDLTNAIMALNKNIIDCYIRKGEENTMEEIEFYINLLSHEYFINLSAHIFNAISSNKLRFMKDPQFINLFNNTIRELNITEYYLINRYGSYILINQDNRFVFVCYTQDTLDEICEIYSDEASVKNYIDKINNEQYIPFFDINVDPLEIRCLDWSTCLYKASKTDNYYWTLVNLNSSPKGN